MTTGSFESSLLADCEMIIRYSAILLFGYYPLHGFVEIFFWFGFAGFGFQTVEKIFQCFTVSLNINDYCRPLPVVIG